MFRLSRVFRVLSPACSSLVAAVRSNIHESAIRRQIRRGDVGRFITRQKDGDLGDLIGSACPREWKTIDELLHGGFELSLIHI